jgi:hypothetical protein
LRYALVTVRGSPNWYVQWFEGRHSRRRSTGTSGRDEAEAFLAAFRLAHAEAPQSDGATVSELLDWYLFERWKPKQAPETDRLAAGRLGAFFGSTPPQSAGIGAQKRYVDHRRAEGVKDSTIQRELAVLAPRWAWPRSWSGYRVRRRA